MEQGSELDKNAEIAPADQNGREGPDQTAARTDPDKHREKLIFQQHPITSHGTTAQQGKDRGQINRDKNSRQLIIFLKYFVFFCFLVRF